MNDSPHVKSSVLVEDDPPPKFRTFGDAPSPRPAPSRQPPPSPEPPPSQQPAPSSPTPQPLVEQPDSPEPAASYEPAPSQEQGDKYWRRGNYVDDSLARTLDAYSQGVLSQLLRLSWGNHREWCHVGLPKLSERSGFSIDRVRKSKKILLARGIIEIISEDNDNAIQELRGTTYKINLPAPPLRQQGGSQQPAPSPRPAKKDKALKDQKEKGESRCDNCKDSGGFIYVDPTQPGKGVKRCSHREGKG